MMHFKHRVNILVLQFFRSLFSFSFKMVKTLCLLYLGWLTREKSGDKTLPPFLAVSYTCINIQITNYTNTNMKIFK